MTATLDILVDEVKDAIAVPYRAIQEELKPNANQAADSALRKYVWIEDQGRYVQRDIHTGLAGLSRIVVTKGLRPGDVLLVPKRVM